MQDKLDQVAHKQSPNLSPAPPSLVMVRQQNRTDKRWYQWQRRQSHPAPDTAVAVVADTDGISKANGSQKLISERDFCLGAPLRLLLLLCRCVVVVGRHGRCACCLRRRCRRENRKRDIFLPPIPFPSEPLALMFGGHRG